MIKRMWEDYIVDEEINALNFHAKKLQICWSVGMNFNISVKNFVQNKNMML